VIGPTIGGIVYERAPEGKLAVFAITMALGAVGIVLRVLLKEADRTVVRALPVVTGSDLDLQLLEREDKSRKASRDTVDTALSSPVSSSNSQVSSKTKQMGQLKGIRTLVRSSRLAAALLGIYINELFVFPLSLSLPFFDSPPNPERY